MEKHSGLKIVNFDEMLASEAPKARNREYRTRTCNLCSTKFSTRLPHRVFCDKCRRENELYLYSEWLPLGGTDIGHTAAKKMAA